MNIDRNLIEHVASLARLKLTDEEIEKFTPQLKEALEFFSKLQEVNTEGVEPSFHPVGIKNSVRDDKETEAGCLSQEDCLSLSEHRKDSYFKGPKII